jgi:hypothetical protein
MNQRSRSNLPGLVREAGATCRDAFGIAAPNVAAGAAAAFAARAFSAASAQWLKP